MTDQQPKRNPQVNENLPPTTPILPSQLTSGRRRPSCGIAVWGGAGGCRGSFSREVPCPPCLPLGEALEVRGRFPWDPSPKGRQEGREPRGRTHDPGRERRIAAAGAAAGGGGRA